MAQTTHFPDCQHGNEPFPTLGSIGAQQRRAAEGPLVSGSDDPAVLSDEQAAGKAGLAAVVVNPSLSIHGAFPMKGVVPLVITTTFVVAEERVACDNVS
jgi:hypothetical protein